MRFEFPIVPRWNAVQPPTWRERRSDPELDARPGYERERRGRRLGRVGVDETRLFFANAGLVTLQNLATLIPPDSGWKLKDVYSINDRIQILGLGVNPEGRRTASY
jgi:hypothetical protein